MKKEFVLSDKKVTGDDGYIGYWENDVKEFIKIISDLCIKYIDYEAVAIIFREIEKRAGDLK